MRSRMPGLDTADSRRVRGNASHGRERPPRGGGPGILRSDRAARNLLTRR